jgi:hypothetical protein
VIPDLPRPKPRVRFTIGTLMISIAGVALLLVVLRPIAAVFRTITPEIAKFIDQMATFETGVVLSCLLIGGFAVMRLMAEDETM